MKIYYPTVPFYHLDISMDIFPPSIPEGFDTVICVNVLEHVEKDEQALINMRELLKPSGRLLLFVPRLEGLYGSVDKEVGHFRRYNKGNLRKKIERVELEIEKLRYYNLLGISGWFINGKIFHRRSFPVLQTILFDRIVPMLSRTEKYWAPQWGMSLFVVARKREN